MPKVSMSLDLDNLKIKGLGSIVKGHDETNQIEELQDYIQNNAFQKIDLDEQMRRLSN